ncbi:MAG: hypothetical protein DSO07_04915 [Thermoproteota archaeon]|nr:MAG: hypothetical protein DSO07_04915 [Candidatus Korarchaeota archaeon]
MLRMRGAPLPLKAINEDSNPIAIRDGTGSYKMLAIRQRQHYIGSPLSRLCTWGDVIDISQPG